MYAAEQMKWKDVYVLVGTSNLFFFVSQVIG